MKQRLKNDAILLRFFPQALQLLRCCIRGIQIEMHTNILEPNRHILRKSQRSLQVHIPIDGHFNVPGRNSHRGGDKLTGQLGTRRERPDQEIAGARRRTCPANPFVSLCCVNRPAKVYRTR